MAAIFEQPLFPTSDSTHTSLAVLLYPENVGVDIGILLLPCIHNKTKWYMRFWLMAAIFDLPVT